MNTCKQCGSTLAHLRAGAKWCSEACRLKAHRTANPAYVQRSKQQQQAHAAQRRQERQQQLHACAYCPAKASSARAITCGSAECRRQLHNERARRNQLTYRTQGRDYIRINRARRRAVLKAAYVAPVDPKAIHARDKNICHLCGKKVKAGTKVPHPLAPTLDHLIPLAAGGTHEPANVATAHFICNSRKQHHGGGEQLALLG